MAAVVAGVLCYGCRQRFARFDGAFEEFVAIPRVFALSRRAQERLCVVCCTPGHERPAQGRNGLCLACESHRRQRGQTAADAQHRPHTGDTVALVAAGDLAGSLAGPQVHEEVHNILAPHRAWILAAVGP